jgi:hypothetical protein
MLNILFAVLTNRDGSSGSLRAAGGRSVASVGDWARRDFNAILREGSFEDLSKVWELLNDQLK